MTSEFEIFRKAARSIISRQLKETRKEERRKKREEIQAVKKAWKEAYDIWRHKVYEKDNWHCVICGKDLKDGNPINCQAHHILAKETYPELKYDIMNGATVCYYDHKNSPESPHLNAFVFTEKIVKEKLPLQYEYLKSWLNANYKEKNPKINDFY